MDTKPGDSRLPSNSEAFQPVDCSTLKFSTPTRRSPVMPRTDAADHNFDTLKSPIAMESPKYHGDYISPAVSVDADIMRSGRKSSNSYLKQYQEKYGKLGIFRDEDLDSSESRTLCFPFFKESSRRASGRRSFIGLERPDSPGQVPAVATSWDPALMESRYSSGHSPLSASPVSSTSAFRNMLDGNINRGNISRSSGRDWHCSVFGRHEMQQNNQYIGEPPGESADSDATDSVKPDTGLDEVDGSQSDFVKRLAKSNVTILAQTALRELEASYKRPSHDSEVRSEAHSNPEENSSPLRDLSSLASQGRGDVIPESSIDNSIPVINISRDYDANDRTLRKGYRSRSSRRAVSDLGFTTNEPGIVPTPRTAALLSNPAFKKHLAKNMGISEEEINEKDFQYDFKLNLPGSSPPSMPNLETEVSPTSKLTAISLRERLLRTSVSDSSLQPPSCLNTSIGALSSDSSFNSLEKTMSDSILSQSEARDPFTSPNSALNTGFASSNSLSDLNTSTQSDISPASGGKVKFHIPSFREFKTQRKLTLRSPGNHEHFKFDFMSNNAIQEENESETSEKPEPPKDDLVDVDGRSHDHDLDPYTIVDALQSDLMQGHGEHKNSPEAFTEESVLVYDPMVDVPASDIGHIEPPEGFRHGSHRKSDRKSKRSHKSVSRSKAISSMSESQEDLLTKCHETESQDSRGKHRKEPNRRTKSTSRFDHEGQSQGQGQRDGVLEGHQEVKVIKEFKIRDSSKGHSSDSKIMVVMIKDEAKESPPKSDTQKTKDKLTDRPPRPERRKRKEEARKDETYVIQESKNVSTEHLERIDTSESPLRRDGSKSRSSKRSSSRSKKDKHQREDSSRERGEEKVQEFDDKVIGGHPGDGFEARSRSDHFRRSSRRSSRRRFLPKTDAIEEPAATETASTTSNRVCSFKVIMISLLFLDKHYCLRET